MSHGIVRAGIQSVEVGFALLEVLAQAPGPIMLRDLAAAANMSAAKAHRYLVSFQRLGLVVQDAATTRYDLGPAALRLGLASLSRLDAVKLARERVAQLIAQIGHTLALAVWGNHSPTMYADYRFATIDGASVKDMINDQAWNRDVFLPTVGKRGAAIIEARGLSSAASAANAAIDHMRDWVLGTGGAGDNWVTMGVPSNGEYGIPKDVMFGYPVTCAGGKYTVVPNLPIDDFSKACIDKTLAELTGEQDGVKHLL